jgi:phage terminase large subunit-like protein
MLEWSVAYDWDGESLEPVKAANPASWITVEGLAEQRAAVQDMAFRRYHCNQWAASGQHWLPIGAWQACADPRIVIHQDGERVFVGVDVGGERSASAVVWATEDLRIGCAVFHGDRAVLQCAEQVRELAKTYTIAECAFDPWRFEAPALELAERSIPIVAFPQSNARMVPASERLHAAIVEKRLQHPDDSALNAHVRAAIARDTPRGWRIDN